MPILENAVIALVVRIEIYIKAHQRRGHGIKYSDIIAAGYAIAWFFQIIQPILLFVLH